MADTSQHGDHNIAISNVKDADITILIGKSYEYNQLLEQLGTLEKSLANAAPGNTDWLNELNDKIDKQKRHIEQFKQGVMQLAETFARIDVDTTDRLKRAREFFQKGEFGEARAVLETELEQMNSEHVRLMARKEQYETDTLPKLKHNAEEFLVLAQSTAVNFDNPNRFEDTCKYYEQSIAAFPFSQNLFSYAKLLQEHNQFHLAEPYYQRVLGECRNELSTGYYAITLNNMGELHRVRNELEAAEAEYTEALQIYRKLAEENPQAYQPDMAITLNNLALLHNTRNEHEAAEAEHVEALQIRRELAEKNPQVYLPDVATTLNNLAVLHVARNEQEAAEMEFTEALQIRRQLAEKNPQAYLPDVATTLNNLAVLHCVRNELEAAEAEYIEALAIYRKVAEKNPQAYLPDVAMTFNNLAVLHVARNEHDAAEVEYNEALQIRRKLAENNPQAYLPYLGNTLKNFAIFYQGSKPDKERSIALAVEAIKILFPFTAQIPVAKTYFAAAKAVLTNWEMTDEEIEKLVDNG